jgi:hypothetical protein
MSARRRKYSIQTCNRQTRPGSMKALTDLPLKNESTEIVVGTIVSLQVNLSLKYNFYSFFPKEIFVIHGWKFKIKL